ncbi:TetR/AcrR family transcriptional regulator [Ancylomarina longa]|uniref:TetR/AcrR family transcriptional regulator n=1 Tax=Ancylomarina longa TaxID=2487017 RepID=A0A434AFJ8_9BACT|nr:helix-turn-helix domain-containing protein [Ancylomarina longa]RUT73149.1 TetR/AcrR family transcriptional regulator [Ancylomarina longa]
MEKQKENIIVASWELFLQHGIRRVTMDDIAMKIGISKKTLYQYYSHKKDLVEEVLAWEIEHPLFSFQTKELEILNAIDQYLEFFQFIKQVIGKSNQCMEYDLKKYFPDIWEKFKEQKQKKFQQDIQYNIEKGIKEGFYRQEINVEIISKTLVLFYLNLPDSEYKIFSQDEMLGIQLHQEITSYHLHGICTNKGIAYLENNFK